MRKLLVAGNWKCHLRQESARSLALAIRQGLPPLDGVEVALCPAFVHIPVVKEVLWGSPILLGAQDVHWEDDVAATGEVGPRMLAEWVHMVIIGHSERRRIFGESDEVINRKVVAALSAGLRPILCVGETLEERHRGETEAVLRRQVWAGLRGALLPRGFVMAYEPVWAIGTGVPASGDQAQEAASFIRAQVREMHGEEVASSLLILYGGSVSSDNIAEFARQPDIDGALVGGASLRAESFLGIVRGAAVAKGVA